MTQHLSKSLGAFTLWGLGVGYVISGMYFGWNLGLEKGGTWGMAGATLLVIIMYIRFTFCYTEMACAIPKAGGCFDYCNKAFGTQVGFIAGIAQSIEFILAPPAIAMAIGSYFHIFLPDVPVLYIAIACYVLFTVLNITGVSLAAKFELIITILAVAELLVFAGITLPHTDYRNFAIDPLPNGIPGMFAAIPFAIWFFLGIEGVANVAEETINPQKNIKLGFSSAIITLIILCVLTFTASVGVAGWQPIVYDANNNTSDSPLPMALKLVYGDNNAMFHLLVAIGLFGLVASFHGIILAAGRSTYEFAKAGNIPKTLSEIHPKFKTPTKALVFNSVIGIIAICTGKTGELIVMACMGAVLMYILASLAFLALRKKYPEMHRPFKVKNGENGARTALILSSISMVSLAYYNLGIFSVFLLFLGISYGYFQFIKSR